MRSKQQNSQRAPVVSHPLLNPTHSSDNKPKKSNRKKTKRRKRKRRKKDVQISQNEKKAREEDNKMNSCSVLLLLVILCLLLWSFVSSNEVEGHNNNNAKTAHPAHPAHPRFRRTVGQRTRCMKKMVPYCGMFTHGKVTKKFCLFVNLKQCTALDK